MKVAVMPSITTISLAICCDFDYIVCEMVANANFNFQICLYANFYDNFY